MALQGVWGRIFPLLLKVSCVFWNVLVCGILRRGKRLSFMAEMIKIVDSELA